MYPSCAVVRPFFHVVLCNLLCILNLRVQYVLCDDLGSCGAPPRKGIKLDTIGFAAVIHACAKVGDVARAEYWFEDRVLCLCYPSMLVPSLRSRWGFTRAHEVRKQSESKSDLLAVHINFEA